MRRQFVSFLIIVAVVGCGKPPKTQTVSTPAAVEAIPATLDEAREAKRAGRDDLYERALQQLSRSGDPITARRSIVELAMFYEAQERHEEAAAAFAAAANSNPQIAPYLALRAIDAHGHAGRHGEALSLARQLIAAHPGTPAAAEAQIALPALLARNGDFPQATKLASDLTTVAIDEFTEGALVRTADELAESGAAGAAASLRMHILTRYPQSRYTEELYGQLASAGVLDQQNYETLLDIAEKLGRYNRYDQALDLLGRIESRFPAANDSAYFRYVKLRSLFNSRNYDKATQITIGKDESFYLAAELLRARAHWRNDQNTEFRDMVMRLVRDYPKSKEATEGKVLLSKYYITDEIDYAKSAAYMKDAIASGAAGNDGENLWGLGWTYVLAGRDTEALETFARYLASYPDHDYTTNALFWSGKIYAKRGDTRQRDQFFTRLITTYPYAYYSYRARELAGMPLRAPDQVPTGAPFPELETAEAATAAAKLAVVRELLDLGLAGEAARELKYSVGATPEDPALAYRLAELYSAANEPLKAMAILQRRFRDVIRRGSPNAPLRFWEILYPFSYANEIRRGAEHSKIDPYLLAAIIRQESAFNPSVVSNAGAVGLTQIMPAELPRIAQLANLPPITRNDLFEPANAAMYGAAEFRQKLELMNGDQLLAIASYNAGEQAVRRWTGEQPIEDIDLFVDSIPYAETRLYVKNVTRNYHEYRRIYGERQAAAQ